MSQQTDLFQTAPAPKYPVAPGYKRRGTSKEAAPTISRVERLRALVLAEIKKAKAKGLTADEAAGRLGENILSIRPRVSELAALNKIAKSALRRPNASGAMAVVWIIAPTVGNADA